MEQLQLNQAVQEIEKHKEQTSLSKLSKVISGLTAQDQKALELKAKSATFGQMVLADLTINAKATLIRISVITGWQLPEGKQLSVLVDQVSKHFQEKYANVNTDEIEFAFRENAADVKDWGKQINLLLLDEVMIPYLRNRTRIVKQIGDAEFAAGLEKKLEDTKEDLSDVAMKDWLEDVRAKIKANQMMIDFAPLLLYDWAEKKGLLKLSNTEKHEYLRRAADYRLMLLANDVNLNNNSTAQQNLREFSAMREAGEIKGKEIDIVKNLAKRIALYEYLKHG